MISDELTGGDSKNRKEQEDCVSCPSFPLPVPGFLVKPILCFSAQAEGDLVVCSRAASKITHFPAARL